MNTPLPPVRHSEAAFEQVIETHLLDHGYCQVTSTFDPVRAIFPDEVIAFVRATQPSEWAKLTTLHGWKRQVITLDD